MGVSRSGSAYVMVPFGLIGIVGAQRIIDAQVRNDVQSRRAAWNEAHMEFHAKESEVIRSTRIGWALFVLGGMGLTLHALCVGFIAIGVLFLASAGWMQGSPIAVIRERSLELEPGMFAPREGIDLWNINEIQKAGDKTSLLLADGRSVALPLRLLESVEAGRLVQMLDLKVGRRAT